MKRATHHSALLIVLALGTVLVVGCSTFERDWKAIALAAAPVGDIEGRWNGSWLSDANGHSGDLRCILGPSQGGVQQARFHATYGAFLSFEYTLPLTVRREGETLHFSAEADLGWLAGGRYEYEGTIIGDDFASTYTSAGDHGRFQMKRLR